MRTDSLSAKHKAVTISLPPDLLVSLDLIALAEDRTRSRVIARAIRELVARNAARAADAEEAS
jgi:predicted transcriptional regulator